ncbi:hypothetical protein HZC09_03820 [Candidatus Micrarchaeota archaeon]|nr:hypothetical protein [Candidatus Micrarchaeota archaeon]
MGSSTRKEARPTVGTDCRATTVGKLRSGQEETWVSSGATMEYWNDSATDASWKKLQQLRGEFSFTLIGGWAVWLWTRQHKSKDIDIIVDFATLERLKAGYDLQKNDRLRKYEVKGGLFDIDVYVPHYSKLALPLDLLIMKQGAYAERKGSVKGRKDSIDILTLLMRAPVDLDAYGKLLERHGLERCSRELAETVKGFDPDDLKFLGENVHSFKKWKNAFLNALAKR